jgi:hypothetical protein
MQKQRTHPEIIHVICAKLLAWQSGSREEIPASHISRAPSYGSETGRDRLVVTTEGRPALGWSGVQQRYYEWLGSRRRSSGCWLTALIQKLWDIAWDMDNRNRVLHEQEKLHDAIYRFRHYIQPVSPPRSSIFERTPDSPPTTTGLSNGNTELQAATGTCRTTQWTTTSATTQYLQPVAAHEKTQKTPPTTFVTHDNRLNTQFS